MQAQEIWVEAGGGDRAYWRDLWRYRELLYFLAWRDILVRYKQTAFGVAWAVLRPLMTMLVLVVVFGLLARLPSGGAPYPLLVCAGILPWQLFSGALSEASASVLGNTQLVSKIYFPRLIVPLSALGVNLVDFLMSLLILAVLMIYYGLNQEFVPSWRILTLPVFVAAALLTAAGPGIGLAALTARYRDFRFVVPFLVQLGTYVSPVGFSSGIVPEVYRPFYALNPMVGVIEGFRWALLGEQSVLDPWMFLPSVAASGLLLALGVWYFRRTEKTLVDQL